MTINSFYSWFLVVDGFFLGNCEVPNCDFVSSSCDKESITGLYLGIYKKSEQNIASFLMGTIKHTDREKYFYRGTFKRKHITYIQDD